MSLLRTTTALALLTLSACVTTSVTALAGAGTHAAVPMEQVRVYRSADKVPGKYEEIALLNSSGPAQGLLNGENKMFNNMKFKAGQLGANAIILDAVTEPSAGAKLAGAFIGVNAERKGKALAIYVVPDGTKE